MLIATTATVGLLLVGVLALSMTPDRLGSPDEPLSTSTDVVVREATDPSGGGSGGAPLSVADSFLRAVSTLLTSTSTSSPAGALAPPIPLAPSTMASAAVSNPTNDTTAPQSLATLPSDPSESPEPSAPGTAESPPSSTPATTDPAAGTAPADGGTDVEFGSPEDAALALPESDDEATLISPGSTTTSGQSTTSTSSTTTSTTTTTSTSTSTTIPASTTTVPQKQLNNG